jgi:hypothetical protein
MHSYNEGFVWFWSPTKICNSNGFSRVFYHIISNEFSKSNYQAQNLQLWEIHAYNEGFEWLIPTKIHNSNGFSKVFYHLISNEFSKSNYQAQNLCWMFPFDSSECSREKIMKSGIVSDNFGTYSNILYSKVANTVCNPLSHFKFWMHVSTSITHLPVTVPESNALCFRIVVHVCHVKGLVYSTEVWYDSANSSTLK